MDYKLRTDNIASHIQLTGGPYCSEMGSQKPNVHKRLDFVTIARMIKIIFNYELEIQDTEILKTI